MNKTTAQQLLIAVAETQDALKRIRNRQQKMGDGELVEYPDAFDDFRYFGDRLEEALKDIEHQIADAQDIVCPKISTF